MRLDRNESRLSDGGNDRSQALRLTGCEWRIAERSSYRVRSLRCRRRPIRLWWQAWVVTGALLVCMSSPGVTATTDYLMQPGDVLQIEVVGVPDLSARAGIDIDGKISVPLLGRLPAAGLPLRELEKSLDRLLPAVPFRQRTPDGNEVAVFISPQQISISFAEYRPIYVGGDVAQPGELPFRTGMTVGDAISAAGGYDLVRFHADNPFLDSADLRSDYYVQWTELARAEAQAWQLRTELGEDADLRDGDFDRIPIGAQTLASIKRLAVDALHAQQENDQKQETYLTTAVKQAQQRIDILTEQQGKEAAGAQADADDLKRWSSGLQEGVSTYLRYEDARRAALLSATQLLQTSDSLAGVQSAKLDLNRSLVRLEDERRITNLKDLQDTDIHIAELRSQLQAISDKILYVGILRSELVRGISDGVALTIVRHNQDRRSVLTAENSTELLPGDHLDIALISEGQEPQRRDDTP
jgi:polysaccharide export outer membrane protein